MHEYHSVSSSAPADDPVITARLVKPWTGVITFGVYWMPRLRGA